MTAPGGFLALVCGYARRERDSRFFVMSVCYGDDSGKGGPYFVVGGLTSPARSWLALEEAWQAALDESPKLEYFKFDDAFNCKNTFHGFEPQERNARVKKFIKVINNHCALASAAICDVRAHKKMFGGKLSVTIDQPFVATHTQLMIIVAQGLTDMGVRSKVDFVFDDMDETTLLEIRRSHDQLRKYGRTDWEDRLGQKPITRDDKVVIALQAADLWAGLVRQVYEDKKRHRVTVARKWRKQLRIICHESELNEEELSRIQVGTDKMMKALKLGYETGKARSKRLKSLRAKSVAASKEKQP